MHASIISDMRAFESPPPNASDLDLLRGLVEVRTNITNREREAFEGMLENLTDGKISFLSDNQRRWCRSVRLEIDTNERHIALLKSVLEDPERIAIHEQEAFGDMLADLEGRRKALTRSQYEWVSKVADRVGVAEPAQNLYSSGKVPEGLPRRERLLPFEQPGYVKPTKPPGRR